MRKKILITIIMVSVGLTGCAGSMNLTDKENNMVAEYTAGLMLKYDENHENKLQNQVVDSDGELVAAKTEDTEVVESEPTNAPTSTPISTTTTNAAAESTKSDNATDASTSTSDADTTTTDEKTTSYEKLSSVFEQKYFDITYAEYSLCRTYPNDKSDSYFSLRADEGNEFLVLEFKIKNNTKKLKKINMLSTNIEYKLNVNNGTTYSSAITLLLNDIHSINTDIKAQKTKKAVLVFEVPKDIKIDQLDLLVTNDKKTALVNIR